MLMTNLKIRAALSENKMSIADLADVLGVSERTAFRKMRKEMTEAEQIEIISKIENCVYARWQKLIEKRKTEAQHEKSTEDRRAAE